MKLLLKLFPWRIRMTKINLLGKPRRTTSRKMEVVEVLPGIWVANYKGVSCIGNSFTDASKACWKEAGLK